MLVGTAEQLSQIATGEAPFEGLRDLLIMLLKSENSLGSRVEGREIIRGERFALEDREVDLDLVEPARMDGQMDQDEIGPLCAQPGFCAPPPVMFSALAARTSIPPHTGSTNARAIVHLPLILPGPAGFRVGNEVRAWRMGEAWVFDDTIEHEAWNDADETRVLLIFDVWNPLLSPTERELLNATLAARDAWFAEESATREPDRTPP